MKLEGFDAIESAILEFFNRFLTSVVKMPFGTQPTCDPIRYLHGHNLCDMDQRSEGFFGHLVQTGKARKVHFE